MVHKRAAESFAPMAALYVKQEDVGLLSSSALIYGFTHPQASDRLVTRNSGQTADECLRLRTN